MSSSKSVVCIAIAAMTALALAGCSATAPPPNDPIAIDEQYGIPAGSVPSVLVEARRSDDQWPSAGAAI